MSLLTLIVDDEPIARRALHEELSGFPEIGTIWEASDGNSALTAILNHSPDLVFLDLQMPGLNGFDVIRELPSVGRVPQIVIVTAFNEHAIQAFESGAVDYLLKPVSRERLALAVERVLKACDQPTRKTEKLASVRALAESSRSKAARKIVARSNDEYLLLNLDEVLAFEADGDLVWIITAKKRYLATQTLRTIQDKLQNTPFRRIHRKALVNLEHVRKMSTLSSQRWLITLSNDREFIVSKRQAGNVRRLLSW
ncbi:MAG TPA: LytTR family DNA-binding domain-containing protein [Bryobacteraceae bacterium]|nr:LytTR family DNA-binding domain-containing protein [Bryobacteraceae bacterium]